MQVAMHLSNEQIQDLMFLRRVCHAKVQQCDRQRAALTAAMEQLSAAAATAAAAIATTAAAVAAGDSGGVVAAGGAAIATDGGDGVATAAAAGGPAVTDHKDTAAADLAEQLRQNAMECRGVMHNWAQAMLYGVSWSAKPLPCTCQAHKYGHVGRRGSSV